MKIYDFEQGSPEWEAIRAGKFTGSVDFQQLVTGRRDTQEKLIRKKAAERLTGQAVMSEYSNAAMERGKELEAGAVEAFELGTGLAVQRVGFCEGSDWYGASPDGLVGDDAGIEIKCKDVHTHLNCFLDGWDKSYKFQIQGNLYVTGRKLWYFVSFNPYYALFGKHLFIEKIQRDEVLIQQIDEAISKGALAVQAIMKTIRPEGI